MYYISYISVYSLYPRKAVRACGLFDRVSVGLGSRRSPTAAASQTAGAARCSHPSQHHFSSLSLNFTQFDQFVTVIWFLEAERWCVTNTGISITQLESENWSGLNFLSRKLTNLRNPWLFKFSRFIFYIVIFDLIWL